jgi:hypothetical protein
MRKIVTTYWLVCVAICGGQTMSAFQKPAPPPLPSVLRDITAWDLRSHLAFLASDALEGRYTPSPGLEIAAQFIASQFSAAGLEPAGDQGYFQNAHMVDRKMPKAQSDLTLQTGSETIQVPASAITMTEVRAAAHVVNAPVVAVSSDSANWKEEDLAGKAVVVELPAKVDRAAYMKVRRLTTAISESKAAVLILVASKPWPVMGGSRLLAADDLAASRAPVVSVVSKPIQQWMQAGAKGTVSLEIPAPEDQLVVVKNVIGVLRGSDPKLKDTYVLLTAHYDHIGTTATAGRAANPRATPEPDDHIYNGANDDGSGTVSVIEIASALARLKQHPKRTIVFMTFFGEERGELGSEYYGEHPVFPIADTVADLNLEQVGRTDSTEGPQISNASVTGYDYSNMVKFLEMAGRRTGVKVYMNKEASDAYFTRSDNASLAEQGVPAHTLCVAYDYPDYHGLGDEWQKIDYANMAKVDRMVALGLLDIANSPRAPQWNAENPKTQPFRDAQAKLMGAKKSGDGSQKTE